MARRRLQQVLAGRRLSRLEYEQALPGLQERLLDAQFELKQRAERAVVLIVSGIPAAGRSEVVNELLSWLDPKLVTVFGFGERNEVEKQRPPLWRYWQVLPPRGRIVILHGGWYRDLWQEVFETDVPASRWPRHTLRTVERIRQLERMLVRDGIALAKVHLHVSEQTQAKRLRRLQADRTTRWRVTREDRRLARHYGRTERALEYCVEATAQEEAPWHLVDGTDAQHRSLEVARRLLDALTTPTLPQGPATAARVKRVTAATRRAASDATATPPSDEEYDRQLEQLQGRLALLSRRKRFARHGVVAVFEGMDAAGKGGAIRRITAALDARQFRVVPVSAPTPEELARPYLWRFWCHVPARGTYAIFDRSWYGRVLVERVRGFASRPDWQRAYEEINEFERQLVEHSIVVAKFWLSVSREQQLERFAERDRNPLKRFKVDPEDWTNREHWPAYQRAMREMIQRTSTAQAPWTIVPADDKRYARLQVLRTLGDHIEAALG